jgi:hypothetical protein
MPAGAPHAPRSPKHPRLAGAPSSRSVLLRCHSAASVLANNLVTKGLTARPKTVTRASEALLLLMEMDAAEATTARTPRARVSRALRLAAPRHATGLLHHAASCSPSDASAPAAVTCARAGGSSEGVDGQAAKRSRCVRRRAAAGRQVRAAVSTLCRCGRIAPARAARTHTHLCCIAAWRNTPCDRLHMLVTSHYRLGCALPARCLPGSTCAPAVC